MVSKLLEYMFRSWAEILISISVDQKYELMSDLFPISP